MICFADTDIILKIAACDLLPQTLQVLGVSRQQVYVYREEAYRIYRHDPDVKRQYSSEARVRAERFVNGTSGIFGEIDVEEQNYMVAAGIDTGEQVIFGATRDYSDFQVITADRKALRTLAHAAGCGGICKRMNGRFFCPEQILLRLINHVGFAAVRAQVLPNVTHDAAFGDAFRAGATQQEAESQLNGRLTKLRMETGELLVL